MNMLANVINPTVSMTSREIAELVGSRHADVKRSIDRLASAGVISKAPTAFLEEISNLGHPVKREVYVFEGQQGKRDSIVVVAQLSPAFTARLVDRWQELEAQVAGGGFHIPQTYEEALRLAADKVAEVKALTQQVQEQEDVIEHLGPKAQFHDEVHDATGLMTMGDAANRLQVGRTTLFHILRGKGVLKKDGGKYNTPYQTYIDRGVFKVRTHLTYTNKQVHVSHATYVTPKGLTFLFKLLQDW